MIGHVYPSTFAETIADAVHAMERLANTQVNRFCEKQTLTRMDFALECDRSTLDDIVGNLKMYGVFPETITVGSTNHVIHVSIVPSK